jgi:nucleotide-binding universal stress UspA family protein
MYKHILIATDGSELAEKAVKAGLMLAKTLGAKATAVTVSEPWTSRRSRPMTVRKERISEGMRS